MMTMLRNIHVVPDGGWLRAHVLAVVILGGAAAAGGVYRGGTLEPPLLIGLILAGAASERFKVGLFGDSHVSLAAAVCMATAIIGGPRDAVVVASLLALSCNLGGRLPLYKTLFNVAVYVLSTLAFRAAFQAFDVAPDSDAWPRIIIPATLASAAYFIVNAGLVAGAVGLAAERDIGSVVREKYLWLVPHYLPLGVLAAAFATVHAVAGAWAILIFGIPAASVQVALYQYSRSSKAHVERLREAEARIKKVEAELAMLASMERRTPTPNAST